ncbi:zinc finger protein 347-like [Cydia pomonella]|uniref:zinc finger protein 347-like n=1 Tax=Cydia pomonella TaxID=82600 RepID=UPI002ADD57AF|nr:zinc finger protein 347-like [Cydia pomonella]
MSQKFIVMNTCRTCLKSPANKNISELDKGIEGDNKQCVEIMAFCLDIKVTKDSMITTNLCYNCYRKIISFYKFKTLSLKIDAYLRSLDDVDVDENGVKHENFLESDDHGTNSVEVDNTEIRKEIDSDVFSLGNVKIDDIDVQSEETLGDTETYEDYNILDEQILEVPKTSNIESHDTKDVAFDEGIDGGEPCCTIVDIKSENIGNRAERTAKKCKKLGSKKKPLIQVDKKVKEQKNNGKVLQQKRKKRSSKKPQTHKAKKAKDLKENGMVSQGPHICEQCGVTVIDIKSHSLTHKFKDERKMLKCKACPKLFISRGGRRRHFNVHHLGRKAKCDICNGHYVNLNTHIMQVHKKAELRFVCVMCGRRFVSRHVLDQHMYTHTKARDILFECDLCHKKYVLKENLRDHIKRVHEHVKNYQCEHCPKSFFARNGIIYHLRMHTKERPFECGECGKAFTIKKVLRAHMLVHSRTKDFKCKLCHLGFRAASNLKTHMITHTKEKRFSCQYCGKRFGRPDSCRRHEAGHQKQPAAD